VEATDIKEDGSIVPGASVGATPELIQMANKVSSLRHASQTCN
jgi:acetyl-CoA hydrolase